MQARTLTYVQLALGMAVFGSATPVSKIVTGEMPVFIGSGLRVAIGALVLLPFLSGDGIRIRDLDRRDRIIVGMVALFGMFGFSVLMLYGMKTVSGVVGSIIMSTTPAVTAVGAFFYLRERMGWRKSLAIALAVAGVLTLHLGGRSEGGNSTDAIVGSLLVFGAVCCEAVYTLLGKVATEKIRPLELSFWASALSLPLFVPFALGELEGFDPGSVSMRGWLAVLWWGAGTLGLGSVLWYSGVSKVEGSIAAGFMGVMPVSALVLSYVLLDEDFVWIHLVGFAIVFAGVILIARTHTESEE